MPIPETPEKQEKQKPGRKKTVTTVTEEEIQPAELKSDTPLELTDDIRHPAAYQSAINAWVKSINVGSGSQYTATLYKYDPIHKQKQSCVCETVDEVMSLDDIGLAFGSGSYRYLVQFPDHPEIPPKAAIFNIHEIYDERRKKLGLVKDETPIRGSSDGVNDTLAIMAKFAEIMRVMAPAPAPASPDVSSIIKSNYEFMQGVLKKSFEDSSDMYKSMMQANISTFGEAGEEEEKDTGLFEKFMPLLDKFLPLILGEGPKAQLTAEMIKKLPEFQKLMADNNQLRLIVDAVKKEIGPVKTTKLIKRLGVRI